MSRPKFFRDPIHFQIRFAPVDLDAPIPTSGAEQRQSWLLRKLIDLPDFQRLRFIRQTGVANLVFHGAEHSRFNHSMGVLYLARTMYRCIVRNMGEAKVPEDEMQIVAAALLHDIGHGPFSHTLEEILKEIGVDFDHETMTVRFITEDGSPTQKLLIEADPGLPNAVAAFIDYKLRPEDKWQYKIVSSQLDADRLDYTLRDPYFCGLKGPSFDHIRILDLLAHHDGHQIGVDEGALEGVEGFLVTLDQLYRAIYYHHAVRAGTRVLTSALKRAITLDKSGDKTVFQQRKHPLRQLALKGSAVGLVDYASLGEHHVWSLLHYWRSYDDSALADLSRRIIERDLFKSVDVPMTSLADFNKFNEMRERAKAIAISNISHVDSSNVDYYICDDAPERTSYKAYNWIPESENDSIFIIRPNGSKPIEDDEKSPIIQGLKKAKYFPRLMMPAEVRELLIKP